MPQQPQVDEAGNLWDMSGPQPKFLGRAGGPAQVTTKYADPFERRTIQAGATTAEGKAGAAPYDAPTAAEALRAAQIKNRQWMGSKNANLHSQAFLDTIPDGEYIKKLIPLAARGELDPKQFFGGGERENSDAKLLTALTSQYDPTWSPSVGQARYDTRQDFMSSKGDSAQTFSGMERFANSLRLLRSASDAMSGKNTGYQPFNHWLAEHQQDVGANIGPVSTFDGLMSEVQNQFAKVTGGGSAVTDAARATIARGAAREASTLERNNSFAAMANSVANAAQTKMEEWKAAFGNSAPIPRWISPQAASTIEQATQAGDGTAGRIALGSLNPYTKDLPPPPGSPWNNPTSGGGTGGSGGMPSEPTNGPTTTTPYSTATQKGLDSLIRAGASPDAANAFLASTADGKGHAVNPDSWNKALQWSQDYQKQNGQPYPGLFQGTKTNPVTPVQDMSQTLGLNGTKGGTFLANYANAAGAGIPEWLAGKQSQNNLNQMNSDHPWMAGLGSAAGFVPAAFAGGAGIKGVGSLLARDGGAIGTLGTELSTNRVLPGLLSNMGVSGSIGASESPGNRLQGAAQGAFWGAAGDAAGGAVVSPLLKGVAGTRAGQGIANSPVGQRIRGMFGGDPTQTFAPPPTMLPGEAKIAAAAKPDINTITDKLTNAQTVPNLPYALGDTTQPLRSLLGSATRFNPEVASAVDKTLADRQLNASTRALTSINDNLAPTSSINSIAADVKARAQKAADPFYQAAYADDPVFSQKLDGILSKPAAQSAFKDATDMAANEGHPATVTNQDGTTAYPLRTLHYTQQALDDMLQSPKFQNADGTMNNKGRILSNLRGDLATETQGLNGNFKQAQNTYSNIAGQGDAAQFGHGLIKGSPTNPIDTASGLGDIPSQNLPYVGQGYASGMAGKIGVLGDNANPFSAVNGKDWQRQNLRQVFPDGADQFGVHQGLENDMHQTNYDVFGNSKTQGRAAADAAFAPSESGIGGLVTDAALMHGGVVPVNTLMKYGKKIGGGIWDKVSGSASAPDMAAQVAPLLMHTDPQQSLADINRMLQQKAVMDAYKAQFRPYGGMFGASAAPGIGQALLGGGAQQN